MESLIKIQMKKLSRDWFSKDWSSDSKQPPKLFFKIYICFFFPGANFSQFSRQESVYLFVEKACFFSGGSSVCQAGRRESILFFEQTQVIYISV